MSPILFGVGILAAFYLGLAFGLNRARRSWQRGYLQGSREAEAYGKAALIRLNEMWVDQAASLLGLLAPVPESDEVRAEQERRS